MNLKEQIAADKEKVDAAQQIYNEAGKVFGAVKYPIEHKHKELVATVLRAFNDKIEANHTCDECSPRYYDEGWFNENGINLRKWADHPNDIRDSQLTWKEVEEILATVPS